MSNESRLEHLSDSNSLRKDSKSLVARHLALNYGVCPEMVHKHENPQNCLCEKARSNADLLENRAANEACLFLSTFYHHDVA